MSTPTAINKVKYLFFNQLFTRLITFSLNLLVARSIGPLLYGYATIQLHLPYTIVLYLCREGLRRASIRYSTKLKFNSDSEKQQYERQNIVNITFLFILLSIPLLYIVLYLFNDIPTELTQTIDYNTVIQLYTYSAIIEMCSESMYILAQRNLQIELRVFIDSTSVTIRCIVIYVLIQLQYGVYAFVYAQLIYTTAITLLYTVNYIKYNNSITQLLPRKLPHNEQKIQYIEPDLYVLSRNFTIQSIEKLILTEGEKIILVKYNHSLNDQGIYSLVSNIGSLVARFIFQPLEESSYNEFSVLCNRNNNSDNNYIQASTILRLLLKFVVLVSMTLLSIGPNYSYIFFELLYGSKWSHTIAPTTLSYYFVYIFVISLNGLTESFVFATISASQLIHYNIYLFIFSTVYILSCIVLVQYGVIGIIVANSINMTCRIVYSAVYIHNTVQQYTTKQHTMNMWRHTLPTTAMCMMLVLTNIITTASYYYFDIGTHTSFKSNLINYIAHIIAGGMSTMSLGYTLYRTDRTYIRDFIDVFKHKKK